MVEQPGERGVRMAVRRQRWRRTSRGMNAALGVVLFGLALILLNVLVAEHPLRLRLTPHNRYALAPKTQGMLGGLQATLHITSFFATESIFARDVSFLLREFRQVAEGLPNLTIVLDEVDPDRDIARTRELARKYDLEEPNVVVFECDGRRRYVTTSELGVYEREAVAPGRWLNRYTGFHGEQAFASAILSVAQSRAPNLYFLQGHGEHDIADVGKQSGYSSIARLMRRDNITLQPLNLAQAGAIPDDCSALVVAGPDRKLADAEVALIGDYLTARHGRVMLLIDPSVRTGLEPLLETWGVRLGKGVVCGLSFSGRELVVTRYGEHPITHAFRDLMTMFYMPRPVEPLEPAEAPRHADRVRVTVLAATGTEGWEESDLNQDPPRPDEGKDRIGPIAVAVAVELGAATVDIRSTRMVVIGDSYFVSNGALKKGVGGNSSLFLSAVNWLIERESLLTVEPRPPVELRLEMTQPQLTRLLLLVTVGIPGIFVLLGIGVWFARR
jgi:ABC-type uncharacterized transport system involved in gliding motility auxiliary subunit